MSVNRGMKACSPAWIPVRILASMTRDLSDTTINLVPLQRPAEGSRFRNRMMGHPTLRVIEWTGMPESLIQLRYSGGIL
jgi:hypothetical protein